MEMRKYNRKYNAYCGGTWNIKIEHARLNMAYVKLLTAIALKPNCTRREAYTFAYGSFLNTAGKEFSACVWTSLRKSGLIDEFIVKEFMGNWHHTYALTEKGKSAWNMHLQILLPQMSLKMPWNVFVLIESLVKEN